MRAAFINQFGPIDQIELSETERPTMSPDQVEIKVAYAGVNPVDWKICEGMLKSRMPFELPIILGWELSGTVQAVGKNISKLKKGDEVFAYIRNTKIRWGSFAEIVCSDEMHVVEKPRSLSFKEAAAIPLTGLTAWQALFEYAKLKEGETILIHAGAGGVGGMAIQLAHYQRARVLTTASQKNFSYVKSLGAEVAIDYHQKDFVTEVKKLHPEGVDLVLDCVGGDTLQRSFAVLKPRGRLVSIVSQVDEAEAKKHQVQGIYVFVRPDGSQLRSIADLIKEGSLQAPHVAEMPLEQVREALQQVKEGHVKGKIVLKIT